MKYRDMELLAKKHGYYPVRQEGGHVVFKNQEGKTLTLARHSSREFLPQHIKKFKKTIGAIK